jgi:carbon-monoxide dehydrogenase medium subunit
MYPAPFNYHRPGTLLDAIGLLTKYGDNAKVIAGGQSLIPMLKLRMGDMNEMIDISRLPDLAHIEQQGNTLHIGALARHAQIAASDVAAQIPLLVECAGGIADKQVRNMGTIGGGLSIADPSGDWPCGLRTLDASVVCTSRDGNRTVSIADLILDSYTTSLASDELITEIQVPIPPANTGSAYVAFKRAASCYPTASAGVVVTMTDGKCDNIRIVLGAADSVPVVSEAAETMLRGNELSTELLEQAAETIVSMSSPTPDARGSEEFKRAMLRSLVVESAQRAIARSRGERVSGGHRYA